MSEIDITGLRFGRLVAMRRDGFQVSGKNKYRLWRCQCECGSVVRVLSQALRDGRTRSCGCLNTECLKNRATHGHSRDYKMTPEFRAWDNMIQRCENPNTPQWEDWGGRGIKVCARWRKSFAAFLADVGTRPTPKHCLDRVDNDRGYYAGNVRWATRLEQNRNRRARGTGSRSRKAKSK